MYPHERSLVKRYENDPFVMLGVNSDSREKLKELKDAKTITWRSFRDEGGVDGAIGQAWNVSYWPTIYLIDGNGKIRGKNLRGMSLEGAIEYLISECKGEPNTDGTTPTSEGPIIHGVSCTCCPVMWLGTPRGSVGIRRTRLVPGVHEWWRMLEPVLKKETTEPGKSDK